MPGAAFMQHENLSDNFFENDPLEGSSEASKANDFETTLPRLWNSYVRHNTLL
jgi:hypothetical protein